MSRRSLVPALSILLVGSACLPQDVLIDGKACPCVAGYRCENGACVPDDQRPRDAGMTIERDAGTGTSTTGVVRCTLDTHCDAPLEVCIDGACGASCADGEGIRCLPGETCSADDGRCVPLEKTCRFDTDCGGAAPYLICDNSECRLGCGSLTGQCIGDRMCHTDGHCIAPGLCTVDGDCEDDDFVCVTGACARRCDHPSANPCRGGSTCDEATGRCGEDSGVGADCNFHYECASGECLRLSGQTARYCTRMCSASSECPLGMSCNRITGAYHCLRGSSFSGDPPCDLRATETCGGDSARCQSLRCIEDTCAERCWRDSDCRDFGGACVRVTAPTDDLLCGTAIGEPARAACTTDAECGSKICDLTSGTCAALCCANADCMNGEHCDQYDIGMDRPAGVCRVATDPGAGLYGDDCTQNDDCASKLCTPKAVVNPNGPRVCSTYCCTNRDCDVLPGGGICSTFTGPVGMSLSKQCRPLQ